MDDNKISRAPAPTRGSSRSRLPEETIKAVTRMLEAGVPVIVASPDQRPNRQEFRFPEWRGAAADQRVIGRWRPGWALAARTGIAFDVIDVDPRHGGDVTLARLRAHLPPVAAYVSTPGGGEHLYVAPYGGDSFSSGGIDYQAKARLIYLPGTSRPKYEGRGYSWVQPLDWSVLHRADNDAVFCRFLLPDRRRPNSVPEPSQADPAARRGSRYGRAALLAEADAVASSAPGSRNARLNLAAYRCGQLVAVGHLPATIVVSLLTDAARECLLADENGESACTATIASGLNAGFHSPRPANSNA